MGWKFDALEVSSADEIRRQSFPTVKVGEPYSQVLPRFGDRGIILLYGPPGSMKSTWSTAFADNLANQNGWTVLFNSTEEGIGATLGERLQRLEIHGGSFLVSSRTNLEGLLGIIKQRGVDFLVLDSFSAGSAAKVQALSSFHQSAGIAMLVIAHCNREEDIAGSASLSHLVDVVIRFYSEDGKRMWATTKNRFGKLAWGELAI
jgi:DNA repair protein RadA/Sms